MSNLFHEPRPDTSTRESRRFASGGTREQIRQIVEMHLERARRTAHAQGVELETDKSLVDHLSGAGYRPEFGARELRRLIRSTLETELARSMLAGEITDGDRVRARWDEASDHLMLETQRDAAADKPPRKAAGSGGGRRGEGPDGKDQRSPARSADEQPRPAA